MGCIAAVLCQHAQHALLGSSRDVDTVLKGIAQGAGEGDVGQHRLQSRAQAG